MAQKRSNGGKSSQANGAQRSGPKSPDITPPPQQHHGEWFSRLAHETARLTGKPVAFITAALIVIVWGATGPLFGYSDTWQLVINTGTTIVTFLMVFLIQHTQNRDTMALQIKLAELIIAVQGAKNRLATAEDLSEEELERLHEEYCGKADAARSTLEERRAKKAA